MKTNLLKVILNHVPTFQGEYYFGFLAFFFEIFFLSSPRKPPKIENYVHHFERSRSDSEVPEENLF